MNDTCVIFDLDDTLYKETDFLKSAFRHIAGQLPATDKEKVYEEMLRQYSSGNDTFAFLNSIFPEYTKERLLEAYRNHIPDITIDNDTEQCLDYLKNNNFTIGIITDGRSITQRNKIKALGLYRYVEEHNIIISEETGCQKPDIANFNIIAHRYPNHRKIYVGDNPAKDFIAPAQLGWTTVGLRDNGQNIHPQNNHSTGCEPQLWIDNILQIKHIL